MWMLQKWLNDNKQINDIFKTITPYKNFKKHHNIIYINKYF